MNRGDLIIGEVYILYTHEVIYCGVNSLNNCAVEPKEPIGVYDDDCRIKPNGWRYMYSDTYLTYQNIEDKLKPNLIKIRNDKLKKLGII